MIKARSLFNLWQAMHIVVGHVLDSQYKDKVGYFHCDEMLTLTILAREIRRSWTMFVTKFCGKVVKISNVSVTRQYIVVMCESIFIN